MKIKVWGCRGSISVSGGEFQRYGGNTTCLEIRTRGGHVMAVDAGSGVRYFGKALRREGKVFSLRFFFTHSHWDHILGFPFFEPAYSSKFTILLCDGPHGEGTIKKYLRHQMEAPFFPVDFSVLKAQFIYTCEQRCDKCKNCQWQDIEFRPIPLSHPNGGFGFKFIEEGKVFVFLTDNELDFPHPGGLTRPEYVEFCRGADLLFHDAQYTAEEYKRTRGWGHSSYDQAVDLAVEAGVKRLGLVHHDPDRTDDELDRQVELCKARIHQAGSEVECFAAAEGMTLEV